MAKERSSRRSRQDWINAARPRTLPASIAPVLVGTAAAGRLIPWRFAAALVVSLSLQVAVNFANDYFDGTRGVDTPDRVGPRRAVASGLISPAEMKRAIAVSLLVAAVAGAALAAAVGPELLLVGAAAILAALAYSGGPKPYASAALGEVAVFVFFGLVATAGSAYVQIESLTLLAVTAGVTEGLLAAAILVVNNLRDIHTDVRAGKITLAVRLGPKRTRVLYVALLATACATLVPISLTVSDPRPLLALASTVVVWSPMKTVLHAEGLALVPALGQTARFQLLFSCLLAGGLWIS